MRRMTPMRAWIAGAAAGALGSFAQDLFFGATAGVAPENPEGAFTPPERQQEEETPTETVARRTAETLFEAGPITNKRRAGKIVHYAYGSAWGGAYGLLAESLPAVRTALGGILYGAGLWMVSENVLLPAFRLRGWPQRYPMKVHAYDLVAHVVYGAAVWAAFEAARRRPWVNVLALVGAAWSTRRAPSFVRAPLRKAVTRLREVAAAVESVATP